MNDPARATSAPELSARPDAAGAHGPGLVLGSVLGVMFAASSVYLSVKVGLTVSASIPVAVLSIALFRCARARSSILENSMVQTTGSAGESLAFGIATALPALLFMGYDLDLVHALLVALLGGVLGVLMMIPLRHGLIVQEHGDAHLPGGHGLRRGARWSGERGRHHRPPGGRRVPHRARSTSSLYAGLKLWREMVGGALGWVQRLARTATWSGMGSRARRSRWRSAPSCWAWATSSARGWRASPSPAACSATSSSSR